MGPNQSYYLPPTPPPTPPPNSPNVSPRPPIAARQLIVALFTVFVLPTSAEIFECEDSVTSFSVHVDKCIGQLKRTFNLTDKQLCTFYSVKLDGNMVYDFLPGPHQNKSDVTSMVFVDSDLAANAREIIFFLFRKFDNLQMVSWIDTPFFQSRAASPHQQMEFGIHSSGFCWCFLFLIVGALLYLVKKRGKQIWSAMTMRLGR